MKTGCHANTLSADGGAERIIDYYRRSQVKTFKSLEFDRGVFQEIKRVSPGCIIIGRPYESEQSLANDAQERFINRSVSLARQYPEVDFWEGYNECYSAAGEGIDKYAAMEVSRVEALARVGAHAAVGCFSCGRPPIGEGGAGNDGWAAWRQFRPALDAAMRHGGALALHEYDAPWMSRMVEGNLWDTKAEGWLCLRYRKVVRWLRSQGVTMYHPTMAPGGLAILLTETGVDGGVTGRPGHQGGGWGDFQDSPDPRLGDYAQQRRWYAWQVSHDAYVRGLTSFGECSADPTWRSFGLFYDTGMTDKIIAAESDLPDWHFNASNSGGSTMSDLDKLAAEAAANQRIQLNPGSGLQKAARTRGWVGPAPTSGEWKSAAGAYAGRTAQRYEWPDGRVEVAMWSPSTGRVEWVSIGPK